MCCDERIALRTGITTGTCAAGASKAYALFLTSGASPEYVTIRNLEGRTFLLHTFREGEYYCVVKDSGDDISDITNGVHVLSRLELLDGEGVIEFVAGDGVGTITLPGLKAAVGEPAINPVPREMIARAVREVIPRRSVRVVISIPGGESLSARTFNPRLGIIGGLSVLGTTGEVKPMNEEALLSSLRLELNMISSLGFSELYIAFAGSGEKFLRRIFSVTTRNVIQCANYPGYVLDESVQLGFTHATICGHPGKLLKVAAGNFCTHSKSSDGRLEALCTHLALMGAGRETIHRVFATNTTTEAIGIVRSEGYGAVWNTLARQVAFRCSERLCGRMQVSVVFIDGEGEVLGSA